MRNWLFAAAAAGALIQQGVLAQVTYPPADTSTLATKTEVQNAQSTANAAQSAASGAVKSVNGNAPDGAGNVAIATTSFINGFSSASPGTVATLMTNAPCNAARLGSYAVVSDLYSGNTGSSTNEVLRCGQSGTLYYWRPQRTDYGAAVAFTGGTLTLNPLLTPPVMYLTGTMVANGTITPSTTYAYPGQQFQIVQAGTLGLFSIQIGGLAGGALSLVTGGTRVLTYTCDTTNTCAWRGA